ncbi:transmembrane protein 253 [Centroberyx affinis]|uniref:transmembrane protein 253 n=1 Tax=Centroberyx affinis TaxID=166261 RepID=UPI003A5BEE2A
MTQNMFQEGLYQVYFKETPSTRPLALATNQGELRDVRIQRWFGTVVNTRLLVTGVVQVLSALACILTTVTHACVSYNCSVSMTTPVWSSLFYVAIGCLAMDTQRKPNKLKVTTLMGLNLFSLLLGFCALLAYSLISAQPVTLSTNQQRAGSYVAKGSSIAFTVLCLLASIYTLFLSWRGLRRYSSPHVQTYSRLTQDPDENTEPLLEQGEFSL